MTDQEVFTFVVTKLFEQRVPALADGEDGFVCRYRGANGVKCAVGLLIPDAIYTPAMEGMPVGELARVYDLPVIESHAELLIDLQEAHDGAAINSVGNAEYMHLLAHSLRTIAAHWNLALPAVVNPYLS